MSAVEVEAPRPRPLSGGLWTLFSWLRRDEHSSSDSLSSVGSDRTAASFAFLGPGHYATNADPRVIPAPGPPTDSYKKRVRDRNLRRHHDRDITLLRKYGLHGFDAFSLPNARRVAAASSDRSERDRRATSELLQRRAHVPGKRRAPLPPSAPSTLTRTRARKRPAPQPPFPLTSNPKIPEEDKDIDNALNNSDSEFIGKVMNSQRVTDKPLKHNEVTMGCKYEKYSKKYKNQESAAKEVKPRQDKSFLKQIFENKKRNSAIETSSVKLLPSISELDKQAHEIIERYKLKELEQSAEHRLDNETPGSSTQVEAWICTRCLRKYNATVITCLYCLPLENALLNNSTKSAKVSNHATQTTNRQRNGLEDKEKLREILKEMKNSLPKTPTTGLSESKNNSSSVIESKRNHNRAEEAATLRIGSSTEAKKIPAAVPLSPIRRLNDRETGSKESTNDTLATIDNVVVTQPEVLVHTKANIVTVDNPSRKLELGESRPPNIIVTRKVDNVTKTQIASKLLNADISSKSRGISRSDINTPLKVSSLFNPIYMPKIPSTRTPVVPSTIELTEIKATQIFLTKPDAAGNITCDVALPKTKEPKEVQTELKREKVLKQQSPNEKTVIAKKVVETQTSGAKVSESSIPLTLQSTSVAENINDKLDQHSRRRNLINQLEQSIAKGDERAAADAAVKLAQLRLSCSVLSFSSQIVAEASISSETPSKSVKTDNKIEVPKTSQQIIPVITTPVVAPIKSLGSVDKSNLEKIIKNQPNDTSTVQHDQIKARLNAGHDAVKSKPASESNEVRNQKKDAVLQNQSPCAPSTSKDAEKKYTNADVPILVWVEDKETTRGPVQIHVTRNATLGELRLQAANSLGLAVRMQRWIIGRALCSDDNTPLVSLAGPDMSAPFYLCLVESETKEPVKANDAHEPNNETGNFYSDLVKLEQQPTVSNAEAFQCDVCMEECTPGKGVVLRECVHSFCNECLSDVVRHSEEPVVSCPATGCRGHLQEREIKGLVTAEDYERWLARGLAVAESGTRHAFHCRTRDCSGWALCEPGVRRFPCPVCKCTNCVPCQAIHEGETCTQHRVKLEAAAAANATDQTDEGTRALLESLIARGEALECPECSAIITKKWGCDWIKCSACKTEICWVTRGRRWGPAGRGDTSAGCRCGLDGNKCHPSCGYCH